MLRSRLIPILQIDGNRMVKTTKFDLPKYVGDPLNAIRIFNEKEVDELILLDISASKVGREPNYELIEQVATECFMPLCYGGGVTNMDQVKKLFQLGIEKVCLRTSAILNPKLINSISNMYGSQATVVALDTVTSKSGEIHLFKTHNENYFNHSFSETIQKVVDSGAGEIIVTSVEREGTESGLDLELIKNISLNLPVPLVVNGGLGTLDHAKQALKAGASAVAGGTFFVFRGKYKAVLISYPDKCELDNLQVNL